MYAPMKFKKDIPSYDNLTQKFFIQRIQSQIPAQKDVNLQKHLAKFEEFKENAYHKMIEQAQKEENLRLKNKQKFIVKLRSESQRYHIFSQKYEQQGIDNWKANMLFKKEREKKDLDYQLKEAQKYQTQVYSYINHSIVDMDKKIKNFENVLVQNNSNSSNSLNNQNDLSTAQNSENEQNNYFIKNSINARKFVKSQTLAEKMRASITEKIMLNPISKRERDRRRRKIIVEQGKAQLEIENKRREEHLTQKLNKQSNQEKQLKYETWRVLQDKSVIEQNRRLRDLMYEERNEMEINFSEKNEEEFLKLHKQIFLLDLDKEQLKKKDLDISLNEKNRTKNSAACRQMVDLIVDIAEVGKLALLTLFI